MLYVTYHEIMLLMVVQLVLLYRGLCKTEVSFDQSSRVAVVTAKGLDVLGKHVMSVCRIEERARNVLYTAPEFNPKSDTLLLHETVPTVTFQSIALPLFSHSFLLYSPSSHFPSFAFPLLSFSPLCTQCIAMLLLPQAIPRMIEVSWEQSVKGLSLHILINNAGQVTVPFGRSNQLAMFGKKCMHHV